MIDFHYNPRTHIPLVVLVFGLLLAGCADTSIEPQTENEPDQLSQPQTVSSTSLPARTPTADPTTLTSTPGLQEISSPTANTPTPTWTPTVVPSLTPTPVSLPELLIAAIEVKQQGEADKVHEVWMMDTISGEKRLVFTTTPGTRLTMMRWGDEQSGILYLAEIKGIGEGYVTWQLYQINYLIGSSRAFFENPAEGVPDLLDSSAQGKWLRILVQDPVSQSAKFWFINTEDGTVTINTGHGGYSIYNFAWSPDEPDVFAYYEPSTINGNSRIPSRILFSSVPTFEIQDTIPYQYTDWGSSPWLVWHQSEPAQILFVIQGELYIVDLVHKAWNQVAQGLDILHGDGYLTQSPAGEWLINTVNIRAIQLDNTPGVVYRFEDRIAERHIFLSWFGEQDWIIVATRDGRVQVYELGGEFELLREIVLEEYGIVPENMAVILAKRLE